MSKAEDLAMKHCCAKCVHDKFGCSMKVLHNGRDCIKCGNYIKGYEQAEKDNELTWVDMERIIKCYQDIMAEKNRAFVRVEDYKEVLNRFNKERNGK